MAAISPSPDLVRPAVSTWLSSPSVVDLRDPRVGDGVGPEVLPGAVQWRLPAALAAVFVLTLLLFGAGARLAASAVPAAAGDPSVGAVESRAYPAWTVDSGDTLWSIAATVAPDEDPRDTVSRIREVNALAADHVLQVGEVLQVPGRP